MRGFKNAILIVVGAIFILQLEPGGVEAASGDASRARQEIVDCNGNGMPDADDVQRELFERPMEVVTGERPGVPMLADFDGDGDLDLAVSNFDNNPEIQLFRNRAGHFEPAGGLRTMVNAPVLAAADSDGDGDVDLIAGDVAAQRLFVFANRGDGTFATSSTPANGLGDLTTGDFDGDGDVDLAVTHDGAEGVLIYINDGAGHFAASGGLDGIQYLSGLAFGDIDADGDLDAFVADSDRTALLIYLNDGAARFSSPALYPTGDGPFSVVLADFDRDGFVDAALTLTDHAVLLRNARNGTLLSAVPLGGSRFTSKLLAVDLTHDGAPELVKVGDLSSDQVTVAHNRGDGTFEDALIYVAGDDLQSAVGGDINGDGATDLLASDGFRNRLVVLLGRGDGTLRAPVLLVTSTGMGLFNRGRVDDVIAADLDGDGRNDVIAVTTTMTPFGNPETGDVSIFANDGGGRFGPAVHISLQETMSTLVAGDLDGDTDTDVVVGSLQPPAVVILENRGGRLVRGQAFRNLPAVKQVLIGDVDRDGGLDLIAHGGLSVLRNLGHGSFAAPEPLPANANPDFVVATDLDGDGDIDLAGGPLEFGGGLVQLINNGRGRFAEQQEPFSADQLGVRALLAGDVDADGSPDLIFVGDGGKVFVLRNNGRGSFAVETHPISFNSTEAALADLDGNASLDLVLGTSFWLNHGDGRFVAGGNYPRDLVVPTAVLVGQLDDSSPIDLAFGVLSDFGPSGVLLIRGQSAASTSADCDGNLVPDECQLATADCNENRVPDVCDPDADRDGVPDDCDECQGVDDNADTDGDGTKDCRDGCPSDRDKVQPAICGCGIPEPGVCGCGIADVDSDADSILDCLDNCVQGANPSQANADGDRAGDACDDCPADPQQITRGPCECGVRDLDGDGAFDCADACMSDPYKSAPGLCGCGLHEVQTEDDDGDRIADCLDNCPRLSNHDQGDSDGDGIGDSCDPLAAMACAGDCDADRRITDADIAAGINLIFGAATPSSCLPFDSDGDGAVRANDLVDIMSRSLGCPPDPAAPTPTPRVADIEVDVSTRARAPAVCADRWGNFVVVWTRDNAVVGQRVDVEGMRLGALFTVTGVGSRPDIACSADTFLVVWQADSGSQRDGIDIFGRVLLHSGDAVGGPFRINTVTRYDQQFPRVASWSTGNRFTVVWQSEELVGQGIGQNIVGQQLDAHGTEVGPLFRGNVVLAGGLTQPNVAMTADGGFSVAFNNGDKVMLRRFDESANPLTTDVAINTTPNVGSTAPVIAHDGGGGGIVMWQGTTSEAGGTPLIARRFAVNGTPRGDEFTLDRAVRSNPLVFSAGLVPTSGVFVATWVTSVAAPEGTEIAAQRFGSDNRPLGRKRIVNTRRVGSQYDPAVAVHDSGFVIVWRSEGFRSIEGVFGKHHDASGNEVGVSE